jgi:hypothetical protein
MPKANEKMTPNAMLVGGTIAMALVNPECEAKRRSLLEGRS